MASFHKNMSVEFEVSDVIPATPDTVYTAWLDSDEHGRMTGDTASVSAVAGEPFEAWGGYIQGRNLEVEAGKRILQSWRTSEFEDSEPDSLLEVLFTPEGSGTRVILSKKNHKSKARFDDEAPVPPVMRNIFTNLFQLDCG